MTDQKLKILINPIKKLNFHRLGDLPNGAYLPYTSGSLDEYDWANYGENKFLVKDGSVYSYHGAGSSEAIMQSPIFPTINTEHRQLNSPLFGTCKVTRRSLHCQRLIHDWTLESKS